MELGMVPSNWNGGREASVEGGDAFIETRYESQQSRYIVPFMVGLFPTVICIEWNVHGC